MTVQTLRLSGKEYTLVPSKEFQRMAEELAHYQAEMTWDLTSGGLSRFALDVNTKSGHEIRTRHVKGHPRFR